MTKAYLIAAISLGVLASAPAQAQLLGGGGLSGGLGGQLGGTLSGSAGSLRDLPSTDSLRSSARGAARGSAATNGSQRVDRRRGSVAIDRSLEGSLDAAGTQALGTPAGSGSTGGSGSARATGSGSANAQLIGTDAVRDAAGRAVGRAHGAASATRERAGVLGAGAGSLAGSARGSGNAGGEGSGSLGSGMLAAAGSAAAAGEGAFAVTPGMPVLGADGSRLGKVREVITDARGRVRSVLVRAKDRDITLPAGGLSGSGSVLVAGEATAAADNASPSDTPAG
jgi:hypothetical protein